MIKRSTMNKKYLNYIIKSCLLLIFTLSNLVYADAGYLPILEDITENPTGGDQTTMVVPRAIDLNMQTSSIFSRNLDAICSLLSKNILNNEINIFVREELFGNGKLSNSEEFLKSSVYDFKSWGGVVGVSFRILDWINLGSALSYYNHKLDFSEKDNKNNQESVALNNILGSVFVMKTSPRNRSNFLFSATVSTGFINVEQTLTQKILDNKETKPQQEKKENAKFSKLSTGFLAEAGYKFVINPKMQFAIDTTLGLDMEIQRKSSDKEQNAQPMKDHYYKKYASTSQYFANFNPKVKFDFGMLYQSLDKKSTLSGKALIGWKLPLYKPDHKDFISSNTSNNNTTEDEQKTIKFFNSKKGTITEDISVNYAYDKVFSIDIGVTLKQNLGKKEYFVYPYGEIGFSF